MRDTSILAEINAERSKQKAKRKYYFLGLAIVPVVMIAGVSAMQGQGNSEARETNVVSSGEVDPTNNGISGAEASTPILAEAAPATTSTASPSPSQAVGDMDSINAQLCRDMISNATTLNAQNTAMYMDSWKQWTTTYQGRYNTLEAQESKQWYKDHARKLFNDLVSSVNPNLQKVCKSPASITDVLVQPNYDQWQ